MSESVTPSAWGVTDSDSGLPDINNHGRALYGAPFFGAEEEYGFMRRHN